MHTHWNYIYHWETTHFVILHWECKNLYHLYGYSADKIRFVQINNSIRPCLLQAGKSHEDLFPAFFMPILNLQGWFTVTLHCITSGMGRSITWGLHATLLQIVVCGHSLYRQICLFNYKLYVLSTSGAPSAHNRNTPSLTGTFQVFNMWR